MSDPERSLTFVGHLEELRYRLIVALTAWILATVIAFPLAPKAIGLLTYPLAQATTQSGAPRLAIYLEPRADPGEGEPGYDVRAALENVTEKTRRLDQIQVDIVLPGGAMRPIGEGSPTGGNFYYRRLTDPIWLIFKAALILGVILALPVWSYQVWAFVAPGLKASEKRVVRPLFALSAILFPLGVVFSYFLLQMVISFLLSIQIARLAPLLDYSHYASFAMRVMVGFGLVFELPVAILLLARLGVVNAEMLRLYRPYAIVSLAVLSMIITPPDPITMMLMLIPLILLYEISIWLARLAARPILDAGSE